MTRMKLSRGDCTLLLEAGSLALLAEGEEEQTGVRRARGVANSGKPFLRGPLGNFAVDLESLAVNRPDLPVLCDHDPSKIAGYTTSVEVSKKGVAVQMNLLEATEHGRAAIALLEAGYPYQMSVYVPPDNVERVPAGSKTKVNGHTMHGEGVVLRGCTLREVTLTALGADERTGVAALSDAPPIEVEVLSTEETMSNNESNAKASEARLSADDIREQHPDLVAVLRTEGAQTERERITAILAAQKGIESALVGTAITEGWDVDRARCEFLSYLQERKEARLEVIREASPEPVGTDDVATLTEGVAAAALAELDSLEGDDRFAAEWSTHGWGGMAPAELREEFGQLNYFQAYRRNSKTSEG